MSVIAYPEAIFNPHQRIGGYYQTPEEIERAADLFDFDVVVPPRCRFGYFMVPEQNCERCGAPRWSEDEEYESDLIYQSEVEKCVGEGGHFWPG